GVHLETDGFDVSGLFAAEHVARAAQFEIERGDLEARSKVGELLEGGEAAACDVGKFRVGRDQQIGIRAAIRAAHAPAQLVKLAEAVAVGTVDDDGVGERYVEAILDY